MSKNDASRRARNRLTNEDYEALLDRWSRQSADQEKVEWRTAARTTRRTLRHLKQIEEPLRQFADCRLCDRRDTCTGTCPAIELYLLAAGVASEGLNLTEEAIRETDWAPGNDKGLAHADGSADEGITQAEFFSNYVSRQPGLGEVQAERGDIDGEIVSALLAGKQATDQIASENHVPVDYVMDLQAELLTHLGCYESVPSENQRILHAIIAERLTGEDAARIFGKHKSDISRRKARARKKLASVFTLPDEDDE